MFSNHVPHAEPIQEVEGPCNFVAGWNMPGYLPEMEPAFFATFDDAKRFILNALGDIEDDVAIHDDIRADEILALRQDYNLESGPFTTEIIDDYVYWVESV